MSSAPEKKPRTLQDVQVDYQNGCLKAGQMQYQIAVLSKDLDMLNSVIKDLNFEAAQLQQINAAAAKLASSQALVSAAPVASVAPAQQEHSNQTDPAVSQQVAAVATNSNTEGNA